MPTISLCKADGCTKWCYEGKIWRSGDLPLEAKRFTLKWSRTLCPDHTKEK